MFDRKQINKIPQPLKKMSFGSRKKKSFAG